MLAASSSSCPQACEAHGGLLVANAGELVAVGDRPCLGRDRDQIFDGWLERHRELGQTGTQAQADLAAQ